MNIIIAIYSATDFELGVVAVKNRYPNANKMNKTQITTGGTQLSLAIVIPPKDVDITHNKSDTVNPLRIFSFENIFGLNLMM